MEDISLALQTVQFLQSIALGAMLSVLYDVFYIIRSFFPTRLRPLSLLDFLYLLLCGILLFDYLLMQSNGRMRYFIFLGVVIGWVVFHLTLSRITVRIIDFMMGWLRKIVLWLLNPVFALWKLLYSRILLPFNSLRNKVSYDAKMGLKRKAHLLYNKANRVLGGVLRGKEDKAKPHE